MNDTLDIMTLKKLVIPFFTICSFTLMAQSGSVSGKVSFTNGPAVEYATVALSNGMGTVSSFDGSYEIENVPLGNYTVTVSYIGYEAVETDVAVTEGNTVLDFILTESTLHLDDIVVTGTKTFKRKTESPVIVNVINNVTLNNVQACNLSEGLKFQPGLRVETDCQTCNYTQLRMNGLAGGYSQILINGRPIFSPLTGLYGMEQLPVNMIDRIEVIRGGGSSLYGSSAIGGTVNILTKIPNKNSFRIDYNHQSINGAADDSHVTADFTLIGSKKKSGVSFFFNKRDRQFYDHNGDNFSELPKINILSAGANAFFLPAENQKLEVSLSNLNEYRFGGEMIDAEAHLVLQSEERDHQVWMANVDYQINFNENKTNVITYYAWQNTDRTHFTGIAPDDSDALAEYINNPPYGVSDVSTHNVGLQINHRLDEFLGGDNVLTFGTEYLSDDVYDDIPAYNFLIDQITKDFGVFLQSDWTIHSKLSLLSGARLSKHNFIDRAIVSPRAALLYKPNIYTQMRLGYGEGFRAPQAFDADLHIAFAGGGISRVMLSPELEPELSRSINLSYNYDRPTETMVAGFTLETFYTRLDDAFYLNPIGEDEFGEVFLKENGQGAEVKGITIETRANFNRKAQLESGFTFQTSEFEQAVAYIDGVAPIKEFIRTPNQYGFANLTITPNERLSVNINYVFTGTMKVPHFAGAPEQDVDEIFISPSFHDLSGKIGYKIPVKSFKSSVEIYGGVKNIANSYQASFDSGKDRDSGFVYGPAQPRTFYLGLTFGMF